MSDLNIIYIVETENLKEFKKYVESKINNRDVLNENFANLFSDYTKIFL
uniref:Uncharacterized protein n=1 Tax=Moumouvirus sp. 'Monve' TaxID=1128131 RepID=H2EDG0_9VIRU|nr:hypothetical protein mv_L228 [Moumouvirus Monve]